MAVFSKADLAFSQTVADLSFSNPFLEERVQLEKQALGKDFDASTNPYWSLNFQDELDRTNVIRLTERVFEVTERVRSKLADGESYSDSELELYDDLAHYVVYYKSLAYRVPDPSTSATETLWNSFCKEFDHWMLAGEVKSPCYQGREHVFSYLHQLRRAFANIYAFVIGRTKPVADLRARIWQSIFTHNMRRYRRCLYDRMHEVSTLVMGPSGTGKELVARAIAMSEYRPFNARLKLFADEAGQKFLPVNLSAMSPTLIESELFGHVKGSFTGAAANRVGLLESAGRYDCVFLDEIGELDPSIQVKLLRVLQSRKFQRIGENEEREFVGKVVSATNRNLHKEIQAGQFREDFYYRICADVISTPSLKDQLDDRADEIEFLLKFHCNRIAPTECGDLSQEVLTWIRGNLPADYHWPGNIRELEQCVRNIMIHNDYLPQQASIDAVPLGGNSIADKLYACELTVDELIGRYCEIAYKKTQSYEKAAELLNLDRRTVKAKIVALSPE